MKRYSVLLVMLGAMLWGTDSLFRRPLTQDLSPVTIVFLEHCVLCVVLIPVLVRARAVVRQFNAREWTSLAFIAIGGSVAATSLFTLSIKYGNPSVTVLLQKTQPVLATLLACWLLKERPGRWFWLCLPAALCGAYLISISDWRAGFTLDAGPPMSIVSALGAAGLWGASTVFGRYVAARMPALTLTALRFLIALPVLAAMYLLQPAALRRLPLTVTSQTSVVVMALIPGLAALVIYYKGLQTTLASIASIAELAFPVTAIVANWFLLDIHLTTMQFLGGTILISSVTVLTWLNSQAENRAARRPRTASDGSS
jgi:drug/metabolite transporter (DMT)-like permease